MQLRDFSDFMGAKVSYFGQSAASTKLMWQQTLLRSLQVERLSQYCKLAQVLLCIPAGSVENERSFSLMNLGKSDVRNRLGEPHLNVCCRLKRSHYTLQTFPFADAAAEYHKMPRRMVNRIET